MLRFRLVVCREPVEDDALTIHMVPTARVGQLKDRLNATIGAHIGMTDVAELPRLCLAAGRRVWSDVHTLRAVVASVGGLADLRYGSSVTVVLDAVDTRDPPPRSPDEEADLERVRKLREAQVREQKRTRRHRKKLSVI